MTRFNAFYASSPSTISSNVTQAYFRAAFLHSHDHDDDDDDDDDDDEDGEDDEDEQHCPSAFLAFPRTYTQLV